MGADAAVLISDRAFAGADTWATALTIAKAIDKMGGADLIFTGKQAIDGDTAQVGPMLATIMGIPYAAWARKLEFIGDETIEVERLLDHGYDAVAADLPAVVHRGQGNQRTPAALLQGQAQGQEGSHPGLGYSRPGPGGRSSGPGGSFTQVVKVFPPPRRGESQTWEGAPPELAARLWGRLKELGRR